MTPWLTTFTGQRLNPLLPRTEDIRVEDMAHAFANINRFNGHPREPINLAVHSVWVSRLCGNGIAGKQGLFHDGSEYLLGDVTKWLKQTDAMAGYRAAEDVVQNIVYDAFGCPRVMLPEVKAADTLMVRVEGEYAWGPNWSDVQGYGPLTAAERMSVANWHPMPWRAAKDLFIIRYQELYG